MQLQCTDNFSFYQSTSDKQIVVGFIKTFKNPICYDIIVTTPGIIWSLKLKTKWMEELLVCGITNTNIKQNC